MSENIEKLIEEYNSIIQDNILLKKSSENEIKNMIDIWKNIEKQQVQNMLNYILDEKGIKYLTSEDIIGINIPEETIESDVYMKFGGSLYYLQIPKTGLVQAIISNQGYSICIGEYNVMDIRKNITLHLETLIERMIEIERNRKF